MSANSGMAFDLSATTELLGYVPEDDVTQHPRPDAPDADLFLDAEKDRCARVLTSTT